MNSKQISETVAQFYRHEGIEAVFLERAVDLERGGRGKAEHGGGFRAHEIEQGPLALGGRQHGEPLRKRRRARRGCVFFQGAPGFGDIVEQWTPPCRRKGRSEAGPVEIGNGDRRLVMVETLPERHDGERRRHRHYTASLQSIDGCVVGHAASGPGAPGHGGCGQSQVTPLLGQGVEKGVGRRVGSLVRATPDPSTRGEQNVSVEMAVAKQIMQMLRAPCFAGNDLGQLGERDRIEGAQLSADARHMNNSAEGEVLRIKPLD